VRCLDTPVILNSDVINSKKDHGTVKTAQWIVEQFQSCNFTSTKIAVSRLWSKYIKNRRIRYETEGRRQFSEFLNTEFVPPRLSATPTCRLSEPEYLISSSGDASSTAMSIAKSLLLENQNLKNDKSTLKSELSETKSYMQTVNKTSKDVTKKNSVLKEKLKTRTKQLNVLNVERITGKQNIQN
jgi:hypothetical protein